MSSMTDLANTILSKYMDRIVKSYEAEDVFFKWLEEDLPDKTLIAEYEEELNANLYEYTAYL